MNDAQPTGTRSITTRNLVIGGLLALGVAGLLAVSLVAGQTGDGAARTGTSIPTSVETPTAPPSQINDDIGAVAEEDYFGDGSIDDEYPVGSVDIDWEEDPYAVGQVPTFDDEIAYETEEFSPSYEAEGVSAHEQIETYLGNSVVYP